jgi:hypothetical protein
MSAGDLINIKEVACPVVENLEGSVAFRNEVLLITNF